MNATVSPTSSAAAPSWNLPPEFDSWSDFRKLTYLNDQLQARLAWEDAVTQNVAKVYDLLQQWAAAGKTRRVEGALGIELGHWARVDLQAATDAILQGRAGMLQGGGRAQG
jgi:hypothetical protein